MVLENSPWSCLVASCETYSDAWPPFQHFWRKYAGDLTATLVTNVYPPGCAWNVGPVLSMAFEWGWSGNLDRALSSTPVEQVLLLQEDFFLSAPLDLIKISEASEMMLRHPEIVCCRLYPCPGGVDAVTYSPDYGLVPRGAAYRVSCQAALWSRSYLQALLAHVDTPQEFELLGTKLSCVLEGEILAWRREVEPWPIQYLCTAIVRGKWTRHAVDYCQAEGIRLDLTRRTVE